MLTFRAAFPWVTAPGGAPVAVTISLTAPVPDHEPFSPRDSQPLNRIPQAVAVKVGVVVNVPRGVGVGVTDNVAVRVGVRLQPPPAATAEADAEAAVVRPFASTALIW
jgi:hypothetical protein